MSPPAARDPGQSVDIDGRRLVLRNLDKIYYPQTATTKGEVLAYYLQVAPTMLQYLRDRPTTRKRWPEGVDGASFFEKNLPKGTPDWVSRVRLPVPGSLKDRQTIVYPLLDDVAALIWSVNLASLELHVPQWTVQRDQSGALTTEAGPGGQPIAVPAGPTRLVVDLDPGPPAGLEECTQVALAVRQRLADDGLACVPVTSGGKGMQLYAPISGEQDAMTVNAYAKELAESMATQFSGQVVSRMTKALRPGKVLLDWSQNNPAKTTICPYSLRGRQRPTAAAPRSWEELEAGGLAQLEHGEVAARLAADGDLLAAVLAPGPRVPQ